MRIIIFFEENKLERFLLHYLKQNTKSFVIKYKNEKDFSLKPDSAIIVLIKEKKSVINDFYSKCAERNIFTGTISHGNKEKNISPLLYRVGVDNGDIHEIIPQFIDDLVKKIKIERSFSSKLCKEQSKNIKKVNIYMPVYYRFLKTQKSINSILELTRKSKHEIKLYIGDNNTKIKEMQEWLDTLSDKGIVVVKNETNIGKAMIINKLHSVYSTPDLDYVFSIDSDMYVSEKIDYNPLDKMIEILEKCDNIGLVSSNQSQSCHHWFGKTIFPKSNNGYNLGYTNNGIGVAGGCIVMKASDWDKVGGYKNDHDIYTGDDSILTYNVERKLCKDPVVAMDFYMVHPDIEGEEEKGYQEWKNKSWARDNVQFIKDGYKGGSKKGYWD